MWEKVGIMIMSIKIWWWWILVQIHWKSCFCRWYMVFIIITHRTNIMNYTTKILLAEWTFRFYLINWKIIRLLLFKTEKLLWIVILHNALGKSGLLYLYKTAVQKHTLDHASKQWKQNICKQLFVNDLSVSCSKQIAQLFGEDGRSSILSWAWHRNSFESDFSLSISMVKFFLTNFLLK